MRVPPPGLLKLDRRALLRDVRERLKDRLPTYGDGETDLTDPGWLLMEQSAWMAEILSGQLDRYPFSVVQHFVHMMGGHLRPAQPALGTVVVEAAVPGTLTLRPDRPSPWRLFTAKSETTDLVEFVPVESGVPIVKGAVESISRMEDGELKLTHLRGGGADIEGLVGWQGEGQRCGIFDQEEIEFVLVTANTKKLVETLNKAIGKLDERNVGWLELAISREAKGQVVLSAKVDPAHAFAAVVTDGFWGGGDLQGGWGTLDDTNWTPPVTVARHPLLPLRVRGSHPLPGSQEGTILIPGVPANFPVDQLLVRGASPMPDTVVEAVWKTLVHQDKSLRPFEPSIRRNYPSTTGEGGALTWVLQALESGVWNQVATEIGGTVAHIRVAPRSKHEGKLRVGLVFEGARRPDLSDMLVFGQHKEGHVPPDALDVDVAWTLTAPLPGSGRGMAQVVALDVTLEEAHEGVIVAAKGPVAGALLNPVMVANMPAVRDGRAVPVRRNVPEGVSLLYKDLVTPAVIEQLLDEPVPDDAMAIIRKLRLSHFSLLEGEDIEDWQGVDVDPAEGTMTLNAPDREGVMQTLSPGETVKLDWYRRTDGARGDVGPRAIQLVEQEAGVKPNLVNALNPVGTFFGASREAPEAAVDRLFAPEGGTPVLPADFERAVRQALGSRGRGWLVRCWSFSERSLVSSSLWPPEELSEKGDTESTELARALEDAGPDCLLVALGPRDEVLPDEDLEWAKLVVQQRIRRFGERLPTVRRALVTRLWPLTLRTADAPADLHLPSHDLGQCHGELVDPGGRTSPPPRSAMLLNAAVVSVDVVEESE